MQVLSVLGQKGGSGKSNTSLGLAVQATLAGRTVAIIDLDPQTTAANWSDRRGHENPAVVSCQVSRLPHVLDSARKGAAELVIIDTPGKSTDALIAAAKVADYCLMPIQPHIYDIETIGSMKDVLTLAGNPPSAVVINRAPVQGRRHIEAQHAVEEMGMTVCPVVLYARAAHGDAGNIGRAAVELDPESKAAAEMAALYSYIASVLQGDKHEAKSTRRRA